MLDLSHIPNSQQNIQVFNSNGITNSWQSWQKPRKCQWAWIMCVGGAGGGAGGGQISSNAATGGGSGAVTVAMFNGAQLPDTLFIQVGIGGAGGSSGINGSAGSRSIVSILPNTTSGNCVLLSGSGAAAGGSSLGSAVAGETAFVTTFAAFGSLSTFVSRLGAASGGPNGFIPNNVTPLTSQITCNGSSGGGLNSAAPAAINGATINATTLSPAIIGGIGTIDSSTNGGDGGAGYTSWKPFFSTGGAGGGNSSTATGGKGGDGGIGSGGGGGGVGSVSGGRGGKGGDGIVIIISF